MRLLRYVRVYTLYLDWTYCYLMTEWAFCLHSNSTEWNQNITFLTATIGKIWAWNVCVSGSGHCVPGVYLKLK